MAGVSAFHSKGLFKTLSGEHGEKKNLLSFKGLRLVEVWVGALGVRVFVPGISTAKSHKENQQHEILKLVKHARKVFRSSAARFR